MTGKTIYYKLPIITKYFKIRFYIYWRDDKLYKFGFWRDTMTISQALRRLLNKN